MNWKWFINNINFSAANSAMTSQQVLLLAIQIVQLLKLFLHTHFVRIFWLFFPLIAVVVAVADVVVVIAFVSAVVVAVLFLSAFSRCAKVLTSRLQTHKNVFHSTFPLPPELVPELKSLLPSALCTSAFVYLFIERQFCNEFITMPCCFSGYA